MIKTIDIRCDEIARGGVLRYAGPLFEGDRLRYDTTHPADLGEIVLGEIERPVTEGLLDYRVDGLEHQFRRDGKRVFAMTRFRAGLIAIPVGNRYAPKCIQGGLHNPINLRPNGEVVGGTTITNLCSGNVAGFVNHCLPADRPLNHIRVLGTLVDASGRAVSSRDHIREPLATGRARADGVLVGGAAMETGKTTFCSGLFGVLQRAGIDVSYIKATGTTCFLGDPLRVQTGNTSIPDGWDREIAFDPDELRVNDFVDACGAPTDLSADFESFARGIGRFLETRASQVSIAELADSLNHRTNLSLLRSPAFRSLFRSLVYIVDPSLDAARNFVHFVRDVLRWSDVRLAFAGPVATEPEHAALRSEIDIRLEVPCLDPADEATLLEWIAGDQANAR